MNKIILLALTILLSSGLAAQSPIPKPVAGKIERLDSFASKYVSPRNIDIWLPEGYSEKAKYAVLYMHDGQMLYDPEIAWNKQAWNIDDVAQELFNAGKLRNFIVVGIWNGGVSRHPDYFPQRPFDDLSKTDRDTVTAQLQRAGRTKQLFQPQSDNYLRFIVEELKPYIDKHYSVSTNRKNTFIAGSSMGGLISMYAICEYPQVFGGAACLSTHWVGTFSPDNNPVPTAFLQYLSDHLPGPKKHKLYFDCGDQTIDAWYPPIQKQVDSVMASRGYSERNWMTKYFPGENHTEKAWNKRLHIPLVFLLGK